MKLNQIKIVCQEIINYLEQAEGYCKTEVISDMLAEIEELQDNAADEIGLEWDGKHLITLDEFAIVFYNKIIEKICNVIKSYQGGPNE